MRDRICVWNNSRSEARIRSKNKLMQALQYQHDHYLWRNSIALVALIFNGKFTKSNKEETFY